MEADRLSCGRWRGIAPLSWQEPPLCTVRAQRVRAGHQRAQVKSRIICLANVSMLLSIYDCPFWPFKRETKYAGKPTNCEGPVSEITPHRMTWATAVDT